MGPEVVKRLESERGWLTVRLFTKGRTSETEAEWGL